MSPMNVRLVANRIPGPPSPSPPGANRTGQFDGEIDKRSQMIHRCVAGVKLRVWSISQTLLSPAGWNGSEVSLSRRTGYARVNELRHDLSHGETGSRSGFLPKPRKANRWPSCCLRSSWCARSTARFRSEMHLLPITLFSLGLPTRPAIYETGARSRSAARSNGSRFETPSGEMTLRRSTDREKHCSSPPHR